MFYLNDGLIVDEKTVEKCVHATLTAIEKELPEEARCFEAYQLILEQSINGLKGKRIVL